MNEREGLLSDKEQELIRAGDIFADDDPILLALKAAARGEIDAKAIGSKKLTESDELVADTLVREHAPERGPVVVRREKPINITIAVQPSTKELLVNVAESFGYWHGGKGSVGALLDAIGSGKLIIKAT